MHQLMWSAVESVWRALFFKLTHTTVFLLFVLPLTTPHPILFMNIISVLHSLYCRHMGEDEQGIRTAFESVANGWTNAPPEAWHILPYVYEAYAGHTAADAAMARILAPGALTPLMLSKLSGFHWLSRTCCLLQPPYVLTAVVSKFCHLGVSIGTGNIVTMLTLCQAEVPSCVRLHTLLLDQLAAAAGGGSFSAPPSVLHAMDRSLRLALSVGQPVLLRDLLRRVLALPADALRPLMALICRALDVVILLPGAWALVAAAVKRLSPGHATLVHWSAWLDVAVASAPLRLMPAALHALAAYAENASILAAANTTRAFFASSAVGTAWSQALFFAAVRVVTAVQAADRQWTTAMVTRLCGEGPHLLGLRDAFFFMRLPRRFRRAHMHAWASLCCLWRTYRPAAPSALTAFTWTCYRGTAKFWTAAAMLCDARNVDAWPIWLRRQLRLRGGVLPAAFYTHVINAMITECEHDSLRGNSPAFLQSLIVDVPKHSPMYPWILCRLLSMPTLPRSVFTRMIPHVLATMERLEPQPFMANAFVDACLRWGLVLSSPALLQITAAKLRVPELRAEAAAPLLRLLSLYPSDALGKHAWEPLLAAPWATPWTRTMVLALVAVCPWDAAVTPPLIRACMAEWQAGGCPPGHYGHVALAGLANQLEEEEASQAHAALETAAAAAIPAMAGPLLAAFKAHGLRRRQLGAQTLAYFATAAEVLLRQGSSLSVDILCSLPLRSSCFSHMSRQSLWVPAGALAAGNWQLLVGLCLRALMSPIDLSAPEAALVVEALASEFPYCLADMMTVTDVVLTRWPALRRQCARVLALAGAGSVHTACTCDVAGTASPSPCYHDIYGLPRRVVAATDLRLPPLECSICYEPICLTSADLLECGHMFHSGCMWEWVQAAYRAGRQDSCPMCRCSPVEAVAVAQPFPEVLTARMRAMASAMHTF